MTFDDAATYIKYRYTNGERVIIVPKVVFAAYLNEIIASTLTRFSTADRPASDFLVYKDAHIYSAW